MSFSSKLIYLLFLFIGLISGVSAQQAAPNILLIIADDMGSDVTNGFGFPGDKPVTPNLDALRAAGVIFTNCWATPQCSPTRAAIMSGKYGINTGVMRPPGPLDPINTSIFTRIQESSLIDYEMAVIGKWHIGNNNLNHPAESGVEYFEGVSSGGVNDYYQWTKTTNGQSEQISEYVTTHFTNAAIDWIGEQNQPWFLWLSHIAPHVPLQAPPEGTYTTAPVDDRSTYFSMIESMDYEIGRLIGSMDQSTLDNTIIFFVGDNGTTNNGSTFYPRGHVKGSIYEGGLRVPLLASGKLVERAGETEPAIVQALDLHATILELVGVPLPGGIDNSLSIKPHLTCANQQLREIIYSDYNDDGILFWATRTDQYKLIENENDVQEFYDIQADLVEQNNLIDNLTPEQRAIKEILEAEAITIRTGWSCNDGIQNGDETAIDDCDSDCDLVDELSTENIGCCDTPAFPSVYYEYSENDNRVIYTNSYPSHDFCSNNREPEPNFKLYSVDRNPTISGQITSTTRANGMPANFFGVALNGIFLMPTPALPFVWENTETGEYNWDWVFEPTLNQGPGMDQVTLDCASAHTNNNGYHYHGNMFEYAEQLRSGISETTELPSEPLQVGWASDGFPIMYRFGPDKDGNLRELAPSFQLKSGLRPGDGIAEPCGAYTGKYSADFDYICGKGDLDQCNGIEAPITLTTALGTETFDYYYVITTDYPQIGRCMVGNFSADFRNNAPSLEGEDLDMDGFIGDFDCDDNDAEINPLAEEIFGNDIDENCDGLVTASVNLADLGFTILSNPNNGQFWLETPLDKIYDMQLLTTGGKLILKRTGQGKLSFEGLYPGTYMLQVNSGNLIIGSTKIIVQ